MSTQYYFNNVREHDDVCLKQVMIKHMRARDILELYPLKLINTNKSNNEEVISANQAACRIENTPELSLLSSEVTHRERSLHDKHELSLERSRVNNHRLRRNNDARFNKHSSNGNLIYKKEESRVIDNNSCKVKGSTASTGTNAKQLLCFTVPLQCSNTCKESSNAQQLVRRNINNHVLQGKSEVVDREPWNRKSNNYLRAPEKMHNWGVSTHSANTHTIKKNVFGDNVNITNNFQEISTNLHEETVHEGKALELFVSKEDKENELHDSIYASHFQESTKRNESNNKAEENNSENSFETTSLKIDKAVNQFGKRADVLGTFLQTVDNQVSKATCKHQLANELSVQLTKNSIDTGRRDNEKCDNTFISPSEQRFDLVRVNRLAAVKNYSRGVFVGWNRLHAPLQMWITRSGRLIIGAHPSKQGLITSNYADEAHDKIGVNTFSSDGDHVCLTCDEEHEPIPSSLKYYEQLIARSNTITHNYNSNENKISSEHSEHIALEDQWIFPSTQTFRCFDDANGLLSFMWLNVAGTLYPQEMHEAADTNSSTHVDSSRLVEISTHVDNQELQHFSMEEELLSLQEYEKMCKYKLEAALSSEDKEFIATLVEAMCKRYRAKLTEAEKLEAKRLLRLRREQGKWKSERERERGHSTKGTLTSLNRNTKAVSKSNNLQENALKLPCDNVETNLNSIANNTKLENIIDKFNNSKTETISVHTSHLERTKPLPLLEITKEDNIVRPLTGPHQRPKRILFDHTLTSDEAAQLHLSSPFISQYSPHSVSVHDNLDADELNNNASKSNIFSYTLPSSERDNKSTSLSLAQPESREERHSSPDTPPSCISVREVSSTRNSITHKSKDLSNWLGELDQRQREYNDVMQLSKSIDIEQTTKPRKRRTTKTYTDAHNMSNVELLDLEHSIQEINNMRDDNVENKDENEGENTYNSSTTEYEEEYHELESALLSDSMREKSRAVHVANKVKANRQSERDKLRKDERVHKTEKEKRKIEQNVHAVLHSLDELAHDTQTSNENTNYNDNKAFVKQEEIGNKSKEQFDTKPINLADDATEYDQQTKMEIVNSMESTHVDDEEGMKKTRHENKAILNDFNDILLDQNTFYGNTLNMPGFFSNSGLYFTSDDDNDNDMMRARRAVLQEWNESNAQELSRQQNLQNQQNKTDDNKVVGFTVTQEQLIEKFRNEAEEYYSTLTNKRNDLRHEAQFNAILCDNFTKDVERLSVGVADEMSAEDFALSLTREVNEYAKAHHLHWTSLNFNHTNGANEVNDHESGTADLHAISTTDSNVEGTSSHATHSFAQKRKSLQPEDMDANYLRQLFEGSSITTKNATCQVNDVDLGYIDSTRRATESFMEDMFTHEVRLMQSVKLATIAIANIMSFHASLELEATCKHCFCIFDNPRTLWPCGHTFCAHCLPDMYNADDELVCAECHSVCEVGYTPNVSLEMMASYQVIQDGNESEVSNESSVSSWNGHAAAQAKPLSLSESSHQANTRERESVASSGSNNDGHSGESNRFMAKNVLYNNIANRNGQKMTIERVLRHLLNDLLTIQSKLYVEA